MRGDPCPRVEVSGSSHKLQDEVQKKRAARHKAQVECPSSKFEVAVSVPSLPRKVQDDTSKHPSKQASERTSQAEE